MKLLEDYGVDPEKRVLWLSGDISRDDATKLIYKLDELIQEDPEGKVGLVINSSGGDTNQVFGLINFIEKHKINLVTLVLCEASSGAAVLLQLGNPRLAFRDSTIGIHEVQAGGGQIALSKLKECIEVFEKMNKKMFKILARRTGKPIEAIRLDCRLERVFNAKGAKEYGLVDKII